MTVGTEFAKVRLPSLPDYANFLAIKIVLKNDLSSYDLLHQFS